MSIEKLRPSFTFTEDRLRELQQVVPEAFADGKINWDTLREALGEHLEDEEQEHFGLTWPGKREARQLAAMPSKGTLVPVPGEGVNEENTHNIFIEGDNLEVLKLLQKSYAGRIKMIYIDPPYNTGNDFIYEDDYSEPLEAYLHRTGQMDEVGHKLTTNSRASGRYHSNWMNMIYPRLLLAKNLLREDGIIYISIDDNEVEHLRIILDEIFGEENFLANIIWYKVYSPRMDTEGFSVFHDYILTYGKSTKTAPRRLGFVQNASQFSFIDENTGKKYRRRSIRKEGKNSLRSDAPTAFYSLDAPDGTKILPIKPNGIEGNWRWSRKKYNSELAAGNVEWVKTDRGWEVYAKQYYSEDASKPPVTIWSYEEVGHTHEASDEVAKLLGPRVFDSPKPTRLVQRMLEIGTIANDDENIILDFFAGSCTSAHAVINQNILDGGNRQFIMVQLPEPVQNSKYSNIAEIGKERIRRVIKKIKEENSKQLLLEGQRVDLGFKSFKLAHSYFVEWQSDVKDTAQLGLRFNQAESPLAADWTPNNLLVEILLLQGFPLDSQVISLDTNKNNHIQRIHSDSYKHELFICLDATIHTETILNLNLRDQDVFICLDTALTDEAKLRLSDRCQLKVI